MSISNTPELESQETGNKVPLYFEDDKTDGFRDDDIDQEVPKRDGDLIQDMGSGSRTITGTIKITPSMYGSGIDDFEDELIAMAGEDQPLIYHEDDGSSTFKCKLRIQQGSFNKGSDITPNMIKASITIKEYNQ